MRSSKQVRRQDSEHRIKGKYAKVNPCYACGRSAGIEYSSHPLTDTGDWGDLALVLCSRCWNKTSSFTDPKEFLEYKKQFGDQADDAWKKIIDERERDR